LNFRLARAHPSRKFLNMATTPPHQPSSPLSSAPRDSREQKKPTIFFISFRAIHVRKKEHIVSFNTMLFKIPSNRPRLNKEIHLQMPNLPAIHAATFPIRPSPDVEVAGERINIPPALRVRRQHFQHRLPGDAVRAADDGAVGPRVEGEGGEAVVDAFGIDCLGCLGIHDGAMVEQRRRESLTVELRSKTYRESWLEGFCGLYMSQDWCLEVCQLPNGMCRVKSISALFYCLECQHKGKWHHCQYEQCPGWEIFTMEKYVQAYRIRFMVRPMYIRDE
jgi:hypothetical protein